MDTKSFELLNELYTRHGAQEFGKICQKILAIALIEAGYSCVAESERGVQGVDIGEVEKGDEKYSIEVKTTKTDYINYKKKDKDGLQYKKEQGYQPILAVLKLDRFTEWFFVKADDIKVGNIYIDRLRVYRLLEFEKKISEFIDKTIRKHYNGMLEEGQSYLDNILKGRLKEVNKS